MLHSHSCTIQYCSALVLSTEVKVKSNSKSELLYDCHFIANQFVLMSSLLRPTNRGFFFD
jgi:hypothetical protein